MGLSRFSTRTYASEAALRRAAFFPSSTIFAPSRFDFCRFWAILFLKHPGKTDRSLFGNPVQEGWKMLNRILFTVVACGVVGFASSVWAAPIVDGNVGGGEYSVVLNDTAPETTAAFYNSGLDIQALHFDNSSGSYWMGLSVVNPK
ncbi:MAG TPA: hypothetical protein VM219_02080, partial [Phycisphaerae bacterium]|nr:hypothetical protein [Phycisphaerae bacterium]